MILRRLRSDTPLQKVKQYVGSGITDHHPWGEELLLKLVNKTDVHARNGQYNNILGTSNSFKWKSGRYFFITYSQPIRKPIWRLCSKFFHGLQCILFKAINETFYLNNHTAWYWEVVGSIPWLGHTKHYRNAPIAFLHGTQHHELDSGGTTLVLSIKLSKSVRVVGVLMRGKLCLSRPEWWQETVTQLGGALPPSWQPNTKTRGRL